MLRYLPSSISRLVKLRSLDLGDNVLEELVGISTVLIIVVILCLQCFDAVGWVAGRSSGL